MNAQNAYLEGRILSADPLELVRILYEEALDAVFTARANLRNGDIAARSRAITRGQLILLELQSTLDYERGGDLSVRLSDLYAHMLGRLTTANIEQSDGPLGEVEHLLMTLLEGWRACRPEPDAPRAYSRPGGPGGALPQYTPMLEPEPELAGHSWVY